MKDELGNRMKRYEASSKMLLPRRTWTMIRVDGKAFHTYTRGLDIPFDAGLVEDMNATAIALCREIQGAICAYVQSDEISVLVSDQQSITTDAWFNGNVQKIASVSASVATEAFNCARLKTRIRQSRGGIDSLDLVETTWAHFDSRCFVVPDPVEVRNYFVWRQQDCMRNSVSSIARSLFSHKQLLGVNVVGMKKMIAEAGQDISDYPNGCLYGRMIVKSFKEEPVTFKRKDTGEEQTVVVTRTFWKVVDAPVFTDNSQYLKDLINNSD